MCAPCPAEMGCWCALPLQELQTLMPLPLRGLDVDNGGAFMNEDPERWCSEAAKPVELPCSQAYESNDQACGSKKKRHAGAPHGGTPSPGQGRLKVHSTGPSRPDPGHGKQPGDVVSHRGQPVSHRVVPVELKQVQGQSAQSGEDSCPGSSIAVVILTQLGVPEPVPAFDAPSLPHQLQQGFWRGAQAGSERGAAGGKACLHACR